VKLCPHEGSWLISVYCMDDPANNVSDEKWALLVEDTRILLRDFAGRKGHGGLPGQPHLQSTARIPNLAIIPHPLMLDGK
jgi:hypothetical protein